MPRRLTRDHHVYSIDNAHPPAIDLEPGELLTVETHDCRTGTITREDQLADLVDTSRVNPASGPIRIPRAEVGDVLAVDILDVRVAERGLMVVRPGTTAFRHRFEHSQLKMIPIRDGHAILSERLRVPLHPMIGVVGVAPAGPGVPTLYGGEHGGNMDTRTIQAGSRVYLPVLVPGALLAVGDLHAAMGEGEVFLSGVEIAGEVDLKVQVLKGVALPTPLVETAEFIAPIATGTTLDEAADAALNKALDVLINLADMDFYDAGRLLSAAGHLKISQYVPPTVLHCRVEIPKSLLAQLNFDLRQALRAP
jgi:amidase